MRQYNKNLDGHYEPPPMPPAAHSMATAAAYEASLPGSIKRDAQARWDAEQMETASCRLTAWEAARFRLACRRLGITRYQAIRFMIAKFLDFLDALEAAAPGSTGAAALGHTLTLKEARFIAPNRSDVITGNPG